MCGLFAHSQINDTVSSAVAWLAAPAYDWLVRSSFPKQHGIVALHNTITRITCVLSAVLGNRIFSTRLADAVDRVSGASERIWFDDRVYRRYPAPGWIRGSSVYESEWVARRWLREQSIKGSAVVNGFTLALAGGWPRMIVATDITPAAV